MTANAPEIPSAPPSGRDLPGAGDAVARPPGPSAPGRARTALLSYGVVVVFVVLFVAMSVLNDAFMTKGNLLNLLEANADIGIVACAGTLVIVAGGLDVSVGAIYALAAVVSAKLAIETSSVLVGILGGVLAGVLVGLFNGLVVTVGNVNSFVATLAGAIVFQSTAQVIAGANLLTPTQASFTDLGRGSLLGVKWIIWLFLAMALVTGLLLARGRFGRQAVVVGANAEAARLSGVPVGRVRCLTFVLSGLAAAIAGVVVTSQSGQADGNLGGTTYLLAVIAAIAIGGTSLRGGQGAIWRTVVGVLFLGLVTNGLHLLDINPTYDQLFIGLLILLAVGADALGRRILPGAT
jgi:ribose transport system permease protein